MKKTIQMESANFFWHGNPLSLYEKLCISSFVKHGFEVNVWSFMDLDIPVGANLKDASEILPEDWLFKYEYEGKKGGLAPFADLFRVALLYFKPGAWWFDTDCVCLKDQSEYAKLKEGRIIVAGWEEPSHHNVGIGALTITDIPTVLRIAGEQRKITETKSEFYWTEIGNAVITTYCKEHNLTDQFVDIPVFYPINFYEWGSIYDVNLTESLIEKCKDSHMNHLWNEGLKYTIDKNVLPPKGSFLYVLFERYFPEALEETL